MKRISFTLLLSLFWCWLAAQCPTGDITFSTQGQIDSFPMSYPGCVTIPGSVTISGPGVTNLLGLSALDSIWGCLLVENNPVLVSLHGLENLTYVGSCWTSPPSTGQGRKLGLSIRNNTLLTSLNGLSHVKSLDACLNIEENPALVTMNGMDSLSDVGLGWYVGGEWTFPLYSIGIIENERLKTIGELPGLDSLDILSITGNDSLVSMVGLETLRVIASRLEISENDALGDFQGLDHLQKIGGLFVSGNGALNSLEGLNKLQTLGGGVIFISENNALQSLAALDSIDYTSIGDLTLQHNSNLSICGISPFCAYLNTTAMATVMDNASGCNSVAEIEAACVVSTEEASDDKPVVLFAPNPAIDFLQIQINDPEKWEISLFDLQGRQMFRQKVSGSQIIEVKDWPSGFYTLRGVSGGRVFARKIVKQ